MTKRRSTEERQRQIAEAALKLISENGVRGFTTAAVAKEVGLAEGTIFRHFANKEEIALEAIRLLEELLEESFPEGELEPMERLGQFLRHRLELVLTHRGVFQAFFSGQLARAAGDGGVERMEAVREQGKDFIRGCLREAQAEGKIKGGVGLEFLLQVIQGVIQGQLFGSWRGQDEVGGPGELARSIWGSLVKLIER